MEEKAKLSFVTTKEPGVFALKLSKHLPMFYDEDGGNKQFETMQSGWVIRIREISNTERLYEIQADNTDSLYTYLSTEILQAKEYDVILVRRGHICVVDEQIYLESYDLQSAAINRNEHEYLRRLAMKGGV